jgi:hypothetical protein
MSCDLYFKSGKAGPPPFGAFAAHFRLRRNCKVLPQQAIYQNEDTGVYFMFELGKLQNEERPDLLPIKFNLNFFRPHIFGLEAELEVRALVQRFDLLVIDPQFGGMGEGEYFTDGFLAGWNKGNEIGYQAAVEQHADEAMPTLSTARIEECWRWNFARHELQRKLGDDIFVPRFMFLRRAEKIVTAVAWTDAIPIAIPEADLVFVPWETLRWIKDPVPDRNMVVAEWNQINPILTPFPVERGALPYHRLRYSQPPPAVVSALRALPVSAEKPVAISVDNIFNAELLARARVQAAQNPSRPVAGG